VAIISYPLVTIILPIRNEALYIERCLNSILNQNYHHDLIEVVIVDGMSTDGTREIVSKFARLSPHVPIRMIGNHQKIVPTGLNIGVRHAGGEIIIRVDGHTTIAPDYIAQCVAALNKTEAENIGGKMNAVGENLFGEVVSIATSSPFGVGGARFHYSDQEEWVDTVYMGAWRREVFERIGFFDEELVRDQDDEFNYRLRAHGGKILLSPKIKSTYTVRGTPLKLWKQYYQYGYWKVRVLQKHPRQMRPRQFVPPFFVAALLLSFILATLSVILIPRTAPTALFNLALDTWYLIPGTYLLANITASLLTVYRKGWCYFLMLPLVYSILHISYGLGFLVGLVRFVNRWGDKVGKVPSWEERKIQTESGS